MAILLLSVGAALLESFLFQNIRPFWVGSEETGGSPLIWEPFALFSRETAIALLATAGSVAILSRLTRGFTP